MKLQRMELAVAAAILAFSAVLALTVPEFFARANLIDLFLSSVPVLIVALGMTLVILTGEIDISSGSVFAIASVMAGAAAKSGLPPVAAALAGCAAGALLGSMNGALVAYVRIPSIVATLAAMIALRDGLRWATQGAWIDNLPAGFQWLGWPQPAFRAAMFVLAIALSGAAAWILANLPIGRAIYATGSNQEAARLAGIRTPLVKFWTFTVLGALTGLAAALNAVRFNQIPSNTGLGLELKVIAAVVVGGAAVTGGSGSITGTILGVTLMGMIGPALTFLGASAYWERAIQGAIILAAIVISTIRMHSRSGERRAAEPA
ncbi:MAG TPA: ABC transporter permease [Bryobacteraceae bacterium]|nr:ABC transporter permease [Bryobacteraceae bacterium]